MKTIMRLVCVVVVLAWSTLAFAGGHNPERYYQNKFCHGKTEVVLQDGTRCDCIQDEDGLAIEIDFAKKWTEALGQCLHYALKTCLQPGIVLIVERPGDEKYVERLRAVLKI